ncbi:MAG: hypothetical protein ABEJ34_07970 [Haloferacaceae archaeon]
MRRRDLLGTVPAALLPAGCLGDAPVADAGVALVDADLRVLEAECGRQVAADASVDPDAPSVTVDGTVRGADLCHTARLRGATYDPGADLLTVHVVAVSETGTPCGQCIAEIDYTATCAFAGGLPGRVRVVHGTGDRRTVVTTVTLS